MSLQQKEIFHEDEEECFHDIEEENHFTEILNSFLDYERISFVKQNKIKQNLSGLKELNFIPDIIKTTTENYYNIKKNYDFFLKMISPHLLGKELKLQNDEIFGRKYFLSEEDFKKNTIKTNPSNYDKVLSTLKQFVRDWSTEGKEERTVCYGLILNTLVKYFKTPSTNIKVLTPGAGLGRLSWEIANLGFTSEGNECTYFMLIASNFILNQTKFIEEFEIFPYTHVQSNHLMRKDQQRSVKIPDINPSILPENSNFSMVAGDFLEIYSKQKNEWNCIISCFFIDTSRNIFEYIDTIWNALDDDGIWINFGPLLYHWAEIPGEYSIELSYDELREVIKLKDFEIVEESLKQSTYASNKKSMIQAIYRNVFFVAKKKSKKENKSPERKKMKMEDE
eukprot:gene7479-11803_t